MNRSIIIWYKGKVNGFMSQ